MQFMQHSALQPAPFGAIPSPMTTADKPPPERKPKRLTDEERRALIKRIGEQDREIVRALAPV